MLSQDIAGCSHRWRSWLRTRYFIFFWVERGTIWVNTLPKDAILNCGQRWFRTHEPWVVSPTPYHYAAEAKIAECFFPTFVQKRSNANRLSCYAAKTDHGKSRAVWMVPKFELFWKRWAQYCSIERKSLVTSEIWYVWGSWWRGGLIQFWLRGERLIRERDLIERGLDRAFVVSESTTRLVKDDILRLLAWRYH